MQCHTLEMSLLHNTRDRRAVMHKIVTTRNIEQNTTDRQEFQRGFTAAQISLDLGKTAMYFSRVERVPRYADGERENDAEHSYMLALVAPELAHTLRLPLDRGLISQYAVVHDLVEIETSDYATFLYTEDEQIQKEINEYQALQRLYAQLPPHTAQLLRAYEAQADPESRFVRYVDKLLPIIVDVIGAGERVMREDYNVTTSEALQRAHEDLHRRIVAKFAGEFPDLDLAHELLCELFQSKFDSAL